MRLSNIRSLIIDKNKYIDITRNHRILQCSFHKKKCTCTEFLAIHRDSKILKFNTLSRADLYRAPHVRSRWTKTSKICFKLLILVIPDRWKEIDWNLHTEI
jgi:hypothetical protein